VSIFKKCVGLLCFIYSSSSFAFITEFQNEVESEHQNTFKAGQVWSYQTRQNEDTSKLTVLKVDYFEKAVVVHIRLDNVKLMDPRASHGVRTIITHMAFLQPALQESVIKLVNKNKRLPEFSREYKHWREGDGIGTAWVWHFSVSKALNGLERIYNTEQQSSVTDIKIIKNSKSN